MPVGSGQSVAQSPSVGCSWLRGSRERTRWACNSLSCQKVRRTQDRWGHVQNHLRRFWIKPGGNMNSQTVIYWDFPGGPVAKTLHSQGRGGPSSIPGQEARSHMAQLRVHRLQPETLSAAMKISSAMADTQCGRIHK